MIETEKKNNQVFLQGEIVSEKTFTHELFGEKFYEIDLKVLRLSGQADIIPITISERLINKDQVAVGNTLSVVGQFRSYNKITDGKSKLMLTVFVRDVLGNEPSKIPNTIVLMGHICKPPIYRTTPFNREISDVLVAVNRAYNKSDYIPCIVWGRNARFINNMQVGDKIALVGRIQSREYQKKLENEVKTMTAYEVSVSKIATDEYYDAFDPSSEFEIYNQDKEEFGDAVSASQNQDDGEIKICV